MSEGTTYVEPILSLLLEGPRAHFRRPFHLTLLVFLKEEVGYCCQDTVFRTRVTGTDPPVPPWWGLAAASLPGREGAGVSSESVRGEPERLVPCQCFVSLNRLFVILNFRCNCSIRTLSRPACSPLAYSALLSQSV